MRSRATSCHSPAASAACSFSTSTGVCETTFRSCLCDQTSFSCGATLRSPTRMWRSSPARMQRLAGLHLVEESELVIEFRIERGIGDVAAGRHIEIMQHQRLCELRLFAEGHRDVAGIDDVAEGADVGRLERQLRDHGDAVIALLSVQRDVLIAEPLEAFARKRIVDAFGFLQAQHVRPVRFQEFRDDIDAQPHRIDVPGCQGKPHANRVISRFARVSASLSTDGMS